MCTDKRITKNKSTLHILKINVCVSLPPYKIRIDCTFSKFIHLDFSEIAKTHYIHIVIKRILTIKLSDHNISIAVK